MISGTLINKVKRRCYITDNNEITIDRLTDIVTDAIPKVKRMLGVDVKFDFEAVGNEEELELFKNYCWYAWNDSSNEFKDNYLDDINSLHHKHEVAQYVEEENQ